MAVTLSSLAGAGAQFFNNNGVPLAGGLIYTYLAGTSTPAATYTSSTGLIAHANPIVLDAAGRIATGEVWLTSGVEYKFIVQNSLFVQLGSYDNIPSINDFTSIYAALSNTTNIALGDALIGFKQSNSGGALGSAVGRTVHQKLQESVSVKDFGAVGDGIANDTAAFTAAGSAAATIQVLIPAGVYKLTTSPTPTGAVTWVVEKGASFTGAGVISTVSNKLINYGAFKSIENNTSFYNGIFKYLENNAALTAYGTIGLHGSVESAGGAGTAGTADIAIAAFATNNLAGNLGGVWGLYSTVLREATAGVATHGMEIDVANMGATVQLFPSTPFLSGLTSGIWCCTGGESSEPTAGGSPGVASVGIAIIQNDSQAVKTAKFEKGILFHNLAINGTDGATGVGNAIVFATGHAMVWFNNLNQACAEIIASGRTFASTATRLDFSDFGLLYQSRVTGKNLFQVFNSSTSVNWVSVVPSNTGVAPRIAATGDDTNIDLSLETKGVAYVNFQGATTPATAGAAAGYLAIKVNGTQYNIALNLP
jgi:hypothetical protein